jgi:hypothetical protein
MNSDLSTIPFSAENTKACFVILHRTKPNPNVAFSNPNAAHDLLQSDTLNSLYKWALSSLEG